MLRRNDDVVGRRALPHDPPLSIDTTDSIFFITICCKRRGGNQLCHDDVAAKLFEATRFYERKHEWFIHLLVLMPDHVHFLVSFSREALIEDIVARWKRYTSTHAKIKWQRDFFDHRLRGDEGFREKADYVLENPVRAGLVDDFEKWPFMLVPE
jgi:putative transposase